MNAIRLALIAALAVLAGCGGTRGVQQPGDIERVVTHSVRYGETWETIAEEFYGSAERADELAAFNGGVPETPLESGSGVRIPLTSRDLETLAERLDAAKANNRGLDLAGAGNFAEAVKEFQKALDTDPRFTDASYNLAVTYQKLGLYRNAETVFEGLAIRYPGNAAYRYGLGAARFRGGDYRRAREAFETALDIDPWYEEAHYSLAVTCEKLGDRETSKLLWREFLERFPGSDRAELARSRLDALRSGDGR
jgi:tetratricopeptide (TPR) repeat protein